MDVQIDGVDLSTCEVVVDVHQDYIDVTSERTTLDETWETTDPNGHHHYYDHGFPTLIHVVDKAHWCDGTEGAFPHDPHRHIDESHYECATCRLTVEPGTVPPFTKKHVAGRRDITVDVKGNLDPTTPRSGMFDGVAGEFIPNGYTLESTGKAAVSYVFVPDR